MIFWVCHSNHSKLLHCLIFFYVSVCLAYILLTFCLYLKNSTSPKVLSNNSFFVWRWGTALFLVLRTIEAVNSLTMLKWKKGNTNKINCASENEKRRVWQANESDCYQQYCTGIVVFSGWYRAAANDCAPYVKFSCRPFQWRPWSTVSSLVS